MNGQPLRVKGKYAAFRRVRKGDDMRSNIHAGGKLAPAEITDEALHLAEIVPAQAGPGRHVPGRARRGRRQADGDQRLQPRRSGQRPETHQGQLLPIVVEAMARKVDYMEFYGRNFGNVEMNTL